MSRFSTLSDGEVTEFKRILAQVGFTAELIRLINGDSTLAAAMLVTVTELASKPEPVSDRNPFEQTVEQQLAALRVQNELGGWGISDKTLLTLALSAPAWPKGKDAWRSFRLRFSEGSEGVYLTFERHAAAMARVHGDKFWRWPNLHSKPTPVNGQGEPVERLRLLNGNESHHAVVEWIIISDLSAFRKRDSISAVRGEKSLADEGLALTWLCPERFQAIDYDEWSAVFFAGYEASVPGYDADGWQYVPCVRRDLGTGEVGLYAYWLSNDYSDYSVPPLG